MTFFLKLSKKKWPFSTFCREDVKISKWNFCHTFCTSLSNRWRKLHWNCLKESRVIFHFPVALATRFLPFWLKLRYRGKGVNHRNLFHNTFSKQASNIQKKTASNLLQGKWVNFSFSCSHFYGKKRFSPVFLPCAERGLPDVQSCPSSLFLRWNVAEVVLL